MYGRTGAERVLMERWIADLVAFVRNEKDYVYGISRADEVKVMTSDGAIKIEKDVRWQELLTVAGVFSGTNKKDKLVD